MASWIFKRHTWVVYGRLDIKTPFVKPKRDHAAIGGIDLPASQAEEAPEEDLKEILKNPKDSSDLSTLLCCCPQLSEVKRN